MTTAFKTRTATQPERRIPEAHSAAYSDIPLDEHGQPIGYTLEEFAYALTWKLSEAYGVDFFKMDRLIKTGELKKKDVTNELLLSPAFKFVPDPALSPDLWPKRGRDEVDDDELEREIQCAMKEAVAEMVAEDNWEEEEEEEDLP